MCDKCERLKVTKVGYKTKVKLSDNTKMILDIYKDHDEVFIHTSFVGDIDGRWYNDAYDIEYCPFCGERILK